MVTVRGSAVHNKQKKMQRPNKNSCVFVCVCVYVCAGVSQRIWHITGIATFSSLCVCDRVIRAVCFPSVIKSNRPSSPGESHSKTTAMIDRCRGRRMHTQTRKNHNFGFICHSERKQHGCELDTGLAFITNSSVRTLLREAGGTSSTEKARHWWFAAAGSRSPPDERGLCFLFSC